MAGIKIGFNFTEYATKHGMGIGSVKMSDGSSVKILSRAGKTPRTDFFQVKNGEILSSKGYQGNNMEESIARVIDILEKQAKNPKEVFEAFMQSFKSIL